MGKRKGGLKVQATMPLLGLEDVLFLMAASKFQGKLEAIKVLEPIDPQTLGKVLKEFEKDMAKIKVMFEEQGLGDIYEKYKNGEI